MQGTSNQSPVSSHLLIFPERRLPGSNTEDPQPRTWSGLLSPAALWHSCSSADLLSCRLTRLATPPFPSACVSWVLFRFLAFVANTPQSYFARTATHLPHSLVPNGSHAQQASRLSRVAEESGRTLT
ncbi:uncharacterized protein CCOS01_00522 [Colletotrichum costaricense]|uniref:Uncharacterized protein n=1 Tax=Colletotrichum costaricense TaxID=1209916 RepID=A0AAJ0E817_9PEZI|nr:uncharacterized protein CCOS01_00522 [Colletotrichum costaricense]KAK1539208.1 hypothetical protein CCOS01_00522 [Colletotrichum costaricense]